MIYWVTGAIGSSFWPYYAVRHGEPALPPGERIPVPAAHARFPKEMIQVPRSWAETVYDIRRWTVMESGGHFAAAEEPEALAADVRAFFRELRQLRQADRRRRRSMSALSRATAPSTNSDAIPSGSAQLPMSSVEAGSPTVRLTA